MRIPISRDRCAAEQASFLNRPRRTGGLLPSLAAGGLVEILPQHTCQPLPVSLVDAHGRKVARHVRVVMSWILELLKSQLS